MSIDDETLFDSLRGLADDGAVAQAPVAQLVSRGNAARARRSGVRGAAGLGVASLAAVLAATTGSSPTAGPAPHDVSLALAADSTANTSYHVKVTTKLGDLASTPDLVLEGGFDTAHKNAYLTQIGVGWASFGAEREVAGVCYREWPAASGPWPWQKLPGGCFDSSDGWVSDPDVLLRKLTSDGETKLLSRTGSGADEVDVWSYSYLVPRTWAGGITKDTYAGEATVVGEHVVKLTQQVTDSEGMKDAGITTYEFSDFGAPISVTVPSGGATPPSDDIPSTDAS